MLGLFFGFKIFEFQSILGFLEKPIFSGMHILWIFFAVISKLNLGGGGGGESFSAF